MNKPLLKMPFALAIVFVLAGCSQEFSRQTPVDPKPDEGTLLISKFSPMTKAEMDSIPTEVMAAAHENGWVCTPDGMEKFGPGINLTVRFGGQQLVTDENGKFNLLGVEPQTVPQVFAGNQEITTLPATVKWDGNRCTVTLRYSLTEKRDHQHQHTLGPGPGDTIRCLDYNGPYGNQVNYSKWYWRAWVNYVGSDCDMAFFQAACYLDNITSWGPCDGQRNCSAVIGHCTGYHKHTYVGGPRC